ncbi:MAG: hypothetical protein ACREGG_04265 [Candidatus Saccharimonadales bacterium]
MAWLLPALSGMASAAQLTSRSLSIGSGIPSATGVTYTYTFTPSAAAISSVKFVECTTAVSTYGLASTSGVGTCVGPTGCTSGGGTNCINQGTGGGFIVGNGWTNTTVPTRQSTTLNNCAPANNVLCITRTAGSAETAVSHTFTWNTQTNPSTANSTFYIGIYTYSDASFATPVDSGTVASAVVQTLTINAVVAEILNFCVGNTSTDNSTSDPAATGNHDCSAVSGTSVNLGTLDSGHVNVTPVTTNCSASDCSKNGLAMVRSNAINGTVVYYDALAQSGTNHTKALRISGATCDATDPSTSLTDQCFNSAGWNGTVATHTTLAAGTESFGVTVAGVNCGSSSSYPSCTGTASSNLVRATNYNGNGGTTYTSESDQSVTGTTTNLYAWDEGANPIQLATSGGSTTKVLDDEALILKFAATTSITTPFGAYTAKADFIAVSTY